MTKYELLSAEYADELSKTILDAAAALGDAINRIDEMAHISACCITSEPDAYESVMENGSKALHALRTIALRLNRAGLVMAG